MNFAAAQAFATKIVAELMSEHELHTRGLLLDALTCLKSAHEEMLRGNYQRADMFAAKAEVILAETRRQTDALIGRKAAGQNPPS